MSIHTTQYPLPNAYPEIQVVSSKTKKLICRNDACSGSPDIVAQKLYKTVKEVYDFFTTNFNVQDGKRVMEPHVIHWDVENAAWRCMNKNDQEICAFYYNDKFALEPTVVAHEYFHRIVHLYNPLACCNQPGSLNESLADVMAVAFKQWHNRNDKSWNIGSIRNLQDHADMDKYDNHSEDNGHVHENSRIPSHAFYRAVATLQESPWEKVAHIWFSAFLRMGHQASFADFAKLTMDESLQDSDPKVACAVAAAWNHTKVLHFTSSEASHAPKPIKKAECVIL